MPGMPSRSAVHVNIPLNNVSIATIQSDTDYVADSVMPICPVAKQSDRYVVFPPDYWFRTQAAKRADSTESVGAELDVDNTPTYTCDVWAVHSDVGWQMRANADGYFNPDQVATRFVTRQLMLRREKIFMGTYMTTGVWKGFVSGGNAIDFLPNTSGNGYWDSSSSNPLLDVDNLKRYMKSVTGFRPNTLAVAENVYFALRNHPVVLDRIKYTQPGFVDEALLARAFGVQKFVVVGAVINSAQEGQALNNNFMVSNSFLLCYTTPTPSIMEPSAGYIFTWTGYAGSTAYGSSITKLDMPLKKASRVEGEMAFAMKVTCPQMGVYGASVLQRP